MSKIDEFSVYNTKNNGTVRVLKQISTTYKSKPGKIRVKILSNKSMDYISEDEIIFPALKSTLTESERKKRSRQQKEERGEIEISIHGKKKNFDKIQSLMPDLSFSEIVEKLIIDKLNNN